MKIFTAKTARRRRAELRMSQIDFWKRVLVRQSAGSRYESGERRIPAPVNALLNIAYEDTRRTVAVITGRAK